MSSSTLKPIIEHDVESQHPITNDDEFRKVAVEIVRPAMVEDVKSMVSGRKWWLRASTLFETAGKISSASSVVLAFASGSEITGSSQSQILGFVAGTVGTIGMALSAFANFARNQSLERSDALNIILKDAKIKEIPDIGDTLVVQSGDV